jgi:hypothetical protein
MKIINFIIVLSFLFFVTGCNPLCNSNGFSIWGYSSEKKNKVLHVGLMSTDFYFDNAGENQTTKDKNKIENQLTNDLGYGTIGIYRRKEF